MNLERRLGRGLGSLLGTGREELEQEVEAPTTPTPPGDREISIEEVRPNPHQPRTTFDQEGLDELRNSIRNHGVLQPIVVRRLATGFELIAGERRLRASKLAGLTTIPAVIKDDVSDQDLLELALVENVQRRDLDALEKAKGYQNMVDQLGLTQEQVAQKVGLNRATVANHVRLLELPAEAQEALSEGLISMGHARALLGLGEAGEIVSALGMVVRDGLSVRQVEDHVKNIHLASSSNSSSPKAEKAAEPAEVEEPWITDLQRRMQIHLGTRVKVQNQDGYKGKILLEYYGREDLDRLIEILAPKESL